jgi:hypothetical protein
MAQKYKFGDGKGPVPAHQHPNGGGWVADTSYVGPDAWVYGNAEVSGTARVYGDAQVSGTARVYGDAQVSGTARVSGDAWVSDYNTDSADLSKISFGTKSIITDLDINKSVSRTLVDYVKVETKEYIYYYQNSEYATNAIGSDSTLKKMADAVFVLDKIQNKLVKGKVELEQLIDFYVFRE